MPPSPPTFALLDWLIVASYLLGITALGAWIGRQRRGATDAHEVFLAGRSMPVWAVAISVLATAQSAATFIGAPEHSYGGSLVYLSANLGGLLAALILARWFIPTFYRHGVTSIYEYIGATLGDSGQRGTALAFVGGRLLASGARLYIVGLAFALVTFGSTSLPATMTSIVIVACAATLYTAIGGIRAVIWTDVIQAVLVLTAVLIAIVTLVHHLPVPVGEVVEALRGDDSGKLRLIDFSFDVARPYTIWTALIGFTLFNLAAFGTDQDLTQRMLTCRTSREGGRAAILGVLVGWPVAAVFLVLGLGLYVAYTRADIMGDALLHAPPTDTRTVFLGYILQEIPTGIRGIMVAGLFAAAMSSTDSALNAIASVLVTDLRWRGSSGRSAGAQARLAMAAAGGALGGTAAIIAWLHASSEQPVLDLALSVMVFAYSGLLGVFLTALFTPRGNGASAIAALLTGAVVTFVLGSSWFSEQLVAWAPDHNGGLAFPWRMTIATAAAFGVCAAGRRGSSDREQPSADRT